MVPLSTRFVFCSPIDRFKPGSISHAAECFGGDLHVDPGGNAVIVQINIGRIGIASHNDLCKTAVFRFLFLRRKSDCLRQQMPPAACSRAEMHGVRFCVSFGLFILLLPLLIASAAQLCCCNSSFRAAWISVRHCSRSGLNARTHRSGSSARLFRGRRLFISAFAGQRIGYIGQRDQLCADGEFHRPSAHPGSRAHPSARGASGRSRRRSAAAAARQIIQIMQHPGSKHTVGLNDFKFLRGQFCRVY